MKISAITICVDYADHLDRSLHLWHAGADELLVVTTPADIATIELCDSQGVAHLETNVFYERGAMFNKAGALNEGLRLMDKPDWILFFDADIEPEVYWRGHVENENPKPGNLYGARRYRKDGQREFDPRICGWFMLAHSSDPNCGPFIEYTNASGYDTEFERRWPEDRRAWMESLRLIHHGEPGQNWCGRGNVRGMLQLNAERRRLRGFEHERI